MSFYQLIKEFGLSKTMFAYCFNVDVSNFSKAITHGGRLLPDRALRFFSRMSKMAANLPEPVLKPLEQSMITSTPKEAIKTLDKNISDHTYKYQRLERSLFLMKREYETLEKKHKLLCGLMSDETFPLTHIEDLQIVAERYSTFLKMQKLGPISQEILQNEMDVLQIKLVKDRALVVRLSVGI